MVVTSQTDDSSPLGEVAKMGVRPITAQEEYAKNPELKKEGIEELRQWMKSQAQYPEITEEQLILFYHSNFFDIEKSKKCIEKYYNIRTKCPEFFTYRDIKGNEDTRKGSNVLKTSALPLKDPNGYQIIFHGLKDFEPSKYSLYMGVRLLLMSIDAALLVEGTVPGYIFLFDMKGVKLSHLTRLNLGLLRQFFIYIQEAIPLRLQAIHVVNTLPIIDKVMYVIKPFMKKELLNLIHFHYGDNETIEKFLPKKCLPSDLGGELESSDELHQKGIEWQAKLKPYFDEEEKYRLKDLKKSSSKKGSVEENNESLKNLCID